jgi:hypothetical protein
MLRHAEQDGSLGPDGIPQATHAYRAVIDKSGPLP